MNILFLLFLSFLTLIKSSFCMDKSKVQLIIKIAISTAKERDIKSCLSHKTNSFYHKIVKSLSTPKHKKRVKFKEKNLYNIQLIAYSDAEIKSRVLEMDRIDDLKDKNIQELNYEKNRGDYKPKKIREDVIKYLKEN